MNPTTLYITLGSLLLSLLIIGAFILTRYSPGRHQNDCTAQNDAWGRAGMMFLCLLFLVFIQLVGAIGKLSAEIWIASSIWTFGWLVIAAIAAKRAIDRARPRHARA